MNGLAQRAIPVPAALRPWVSRISVAAVDPHDRLRTAVEVPDHATTLALRTATNDLVVVGPRTRAMYHLAEPGPSCVQIRLQGGRARLLLGGSARRVVDRAVPLADLWGEPGERLARALAGLGEHAVLERLHEALLGRLVASKPGDLPRSDLVHTATSVLSSSTGRVRDAARRLNVSERQLRTLFADAVGISPKQFARIDRVRTVLSRIHHTRGAQLAVEAGYYDQSHMTAEFRQLMGVPPSAFIAGRLPSGKACGQ